MSAHLGIHVTSGHLGWPGLEENWLDFQVVEAATQLEGNIHHCIMEQLIFKTQYFVILPY